MRGAHAGETWHAGPRGRATRTHAARLRGAVFFYIYYIYYLYIIKRLFVLPYMGRVIPLETVGSYKPDGFRNNLRVGLISTLFLPFSDVARGGASDRRRASISRVDRVSVVHDQRSRPRVLNPRIITVMIYATWRHHARQSGGHAAHGSRIKHVPI